MSQALATRDPAPQRPHSAPTPRVSDPEQTRDRSGTSGDQALVDVGASIDSVVVQDLIGYALSPTHSQIPDSTRRLVSPDLVVSLPLLRLPEPTRHLHSRFEVEQLSAAACQALVLFRLPAYAVSLLPFASWDLQVLRVQETALAVAVPEGSTPLTGRTAISPDAEKGGGRTDHLDVVERWSAQVEWILRVASPFTVGRSRKIKPVQSGWIASTSRPRDVELVFTSRQPETATGRRVRTGHGARHRGHAAHFDVVRSDLPSYEEAHPSGADEEAPISATSSTDLIEKVAAEEHALELSFVRYSVPGDDRSTFSGLLVKIALALIGRLVPVTYALLDFIGLAQRLDVVRWVPHDWPELRPGGEPAQKAPSLRNSGIRRGGLSGLAPLASVGAASPLVPKRQPEFDPVYHSDEDRGLGEKGPRREQAHEHRVRRRRWSSSTASPSATSSTTLEASPERVPGPAPSAPTLPAAILALYGLVHALLRSVGVVWAEFALLLWTIRQVVLFATELVEEGWGVAKEVLRQPPEELEAAPVAEEESEQGSSEAGSSEGSEERSRKSALSSGNGHKRESLPHRHVTFTPESPPPVSAAPPSSSGSASSATLSGDQSPERSDARPDAASALALSRLHALVSRQAAQEGGVLGPALSAEYAEPAQEPPPPDEALVGPHFRAGAIAAQVARDRAATGQEVRAVERLEQQLEAQRVAQNVAGERLLQDVDEAARAYRAAGRAAAAKGRRMSGSEREMEAVRAAEARRDERDASVRAEEERFGGLAQPESTDDSPRKSPDTSTSIPTTPPRRNRETATPDVDPGSINTVGIVPSCEVSQDVGTPAAAGPDLSAGRSLRADQLAAIEPGQRRPRQIELDTPVNTPSKRRIGSLSSLNGSEAPAEEETPPPPRRASASTGSPSEPDQPIMVAGTGREPEEGGVDPALRFTTGSATSSSTSTSGVGSMTMTRRTPSPSPTGPAASPSELSALGPQSVFAPAFHPAVMGTGVGAGVPSTTWEEPQPEELQASGLPARRSDSEQENPGATEASASVPSSPTTPSKKRSIKRKKRKGKRG